MVRTPSLSLSSYSIMIFLTFMNLISYVAPALFFFTIHLAMFAFRNDVLPLLGLFSESALNAFVYTIDFIYILNFFGLVFFSMHLTSKNPKFMPYIYIASTLFGIFALCIFVVLAYDLLSWIINGDVACNLVIYISFG